MRRKRKNPVAVFFSSLLRTVVIILAIVIVVLSVILAKKLITAKKINEHNSESTTADESVLTEDNGADPEDIENYEQNTDTEETSEAAEEETEASSKDLKIEVLNATGTKGLAGTWKSTLAGYGYTNIDAHNYREKLENTKIFVAEQGIGEDLKQYFPNAEFVVGSLDQSKTDADVNGVKIFIVIGASDIINQN